MSNKSAHIYRVERYLEEFEIKNIIFISHTEKSAIHYYEELKEIIDLDKYNILFMSERTNKVDGLLQKETLGIMCGVWYKNRKLREDDYFWGFIDSIYTVPLSDIDLRVKSKGATFTIKMDSEKIVEEIKKYINTCKPI